MITVALALALAGIGAPPINPPGIDCPKGFTFKRGHCSYRFTDDKSVFTDEDEQAEQDFYRWIEGELDRPARRNRK